ncbi:uncharacterized protein EV420DRAFT_1486644 [Desarmillaria tabescens]|uniref:Uncharacterized protein n=1 Tax=Armillaria tabescens TaxID=1929756 RepID=A0AA39MLX8_ARMTA|nr:uncharacterized protein EV420DRAFT_1486644 [Desarmillaria tabescens]KAK0438529.1 hypothetical protein EV420DRAFT_1486644 [Desarmillaria tabescens]
MSKPCAPLGLLYYMLLLPQQVSLHASYKALHETTTAISWHGHTLSFRSSVVQEAQQDGISGGQEAVTKKRIRMMRTENENEDQNKDEDMNRDKIVGSDKDNSSHRDAPRRKMTAAAEKECQNQKHSGPSSQAETSTTAAKRQWTEVSPVTVVNPLIGLQITVPENLPVELSKNTSAMDNVASSASTDQTPQEKPVDDTLPKNGNLSAPTESNGGSEKQQ